MDKEPEATISIYESLGGGYTAHLGHQTNEWGVKGYGKTPAGAIRFLLGTGADGVNRYVKRKIAEAKSAALAALVKAEEVENGG